MSDGKDVKADKYSPTYKIYQEVKQEVPDGNLDQGCHVIDYSQPGPKEKIIDKGDGPISDCEILQYVTDRFEKYHSIVEGITGKPNPVSLDDHREETDFDKKIRVRVKEAVDELHQIFKEQKIPPHSVLYQEKLALGLFHFIDFPDDSQVIERQASDLLIRSTELQNVGLQPFQKFLFKKGGLGVSQMQKKMDGEATALEALNSGQAGVSEKGKILFAVFRMAGLNPVFAQTRGRDIQAKIREMGLTLPVTNSVIEKNYTYVGIPLGNTFRYFDLSTFNTSVKQSNFKHLHLRHFFAQDTIHRGGELFYQEKTEEAEALFRKAILIDERNSAAHHGLGLVLANQKKYDEAISMLRKGIQLDPKNALIVCQLGVVLALHNQVDASIKALQDATQLDPGLTMAHTFLGNLFSMQENYAAAIAAYRKASQLTPKDAELHRLMGNTFVLQGDFASALDSYQKVIRLQPNDLRALKEIAEIFTKLGKLEEAAVARNEYKLVLLTEKIELSSKEPVLHHQKGKLLAKLDRFDEAIAAYQKAIELTPQDSNNAATFKALGIVCEQIGKFEEAIAAYRQASEKDPNDIEMLQRLEVVMRLSGRKSQ